MSNLSLNLGEFFVVVFFILFVLTAMSWIITLLLIVAQSICITALLKPE